MEQKRGMKSEFDRAIGEVREEFNEIREHTPTKQAVKRFFRTKRGKMALLTGVIVVLVFIILVLLPLVRDGKGVRSQAKIDREITRLVTQVEQHMLVPDDKPLVFTISDVETLVKEQAFFTGAQNGDRLLIFQSTGKAVIYSPKRDILVNVGPINFNAPDADSIQTYEGANVAPDTASGDIEGIE